MGGGELQQGYFNAQASKIKNGNADTLLTDDDITYNNYSIFAQGNISINERWVITAGASVNRTKVGFTRMNAYPVLVQSRTYKNEVSPRFAIQKAISKNNIVFASISKGFSPPTLAELLPSTAPVNTNLEAEEAVNYELGGTASLLKNKLHIEATGFYFKLRNALVSRKDNANADYFVNAGNSKQKGIELSADYGVDFNNKILDRLIIKTSYTYNDFKYGDFKKGTSDFSGKYLPSVPKNTFSFLADIQFKKGIYFNSTYYLASKIFLDDANSAAANGYHILGSRLGWKTTLQSKLRLNFYVGGDNLLNETYSLGNDINAAGVRYYNAAAKRNYYAGIAFQWEKAKQK